MQLVALILMVAMIVGLACCVMMFLRNQWVYRNRMKLILTPDYERLPTYNEMMRRWWVWDIKKFIAPPNGSDPGQSLVE